MWKKLFFVAAVAIISDQVSNVSSSETPGHATTSSEDHQCYPSVQHLHFRIVTGAVKWSEKEKSPQNVSAPAWAKIIFRVQKPATTNVTGTPPCESETTFRTLEINTRGGQIDWENVTITHVQTGKRIKVTHILPLNKDNVTDAEKFTIQAAEPLRFGDTLEIHIPYKLTLTQGSNGDQWQGLYFYNPSSLNLSSWDLYSYDPYRTPFLFPTLGPDNSIPGQRATFKISVARPENQGYVSLSNMDVIETAKISGVEDGWVRDHFRQSPSLPLDQVAVMILHGFENHTVVDEGGEHKVLVWSSRYLPDRENVKNASYYTAKTVLKMVSDFERALNGTKLPVSKLDVVAVPWYTGDLWSLSNLGLMVSYEDNVLLKENGQNPHSRAFLTRQLGFQWFGGMVSIACASEALQNEFYCADQRDGLLQYMTKLLDKEGTTLSSFSVEKAILDMIEDVFAPAVMKSAMSNFYLPKMKWKQVTPQDFYAALQDAIVYHNLTQRLPYAGVTEEQTVSVGEIVASWHHHKYDYPRIYVNQVDNDSRAILVSQRDLSEEPTGELWWVPLKIATDAGEDLVWLAPNVTTNHSTNASYIWSKKDVIDTTKWLVINPDGTGYFSVEYSEPLWKNIIDQLTLNHSVIGVAARNYLVHNQFIAPPVEHQWGEMKKALELSQYLGKERSAKVWATALENIAGLYRTFKTKAEAIGPFQDYFGSLMNTALLEVGTSSTPGEGKEVKLLREKLIEFCGSFEIPVCTQYAGSLMSDWMKHPQNDPFLALHISPRAQQKLYCAALKGGKSNGDNSVPSSSAAFHFLLNQLVNEDNNTNALRRKCDLFGSALACTSEDQLLVNLLNDTHVARRNPNINACFVNTVDNTICDVKPLSMTPVVYEFYTKELLGGRISPGTFVRFLWSLTSNGYVLPGMGDKIREFLEKNGGLFKDDLAENVANFKQNMAQLETHDYSHNFWKNVGDNMVQWFKDNRRG